MNWTECVPVFLRLRTESERLTDNIELRAQEELIWHRLDIQL